VLGVVVVLDHQPAVARPVQQGAAACRCEDDPGRVLVRRCHEHRLDRRRREGVDVQPEVVDRDRGDPHPPALQLVAGAAGAGVLVADGGDPAAGEHLGEQREALRDPADDHDRRRVGAHPAGAGEPRREGDA
jgi:hypothetical protein